MADFERLLDGEIPALARTLLESAEDDDASAEGEARTRRALGLAAVVTGTTVLLAAGTQAKLFTKLGWLATLKWIGVASVPVAIGGSTLAYVEYARTAQPEKPEKTQHGSGFSGKSARKLATPQLPASAPSAAPLDPVMPLVQPPSAVRALTSSEQRAQSSPEPMRSLRRAPPEPATVAQPARSNVELELAQLDKVRRALAAGDASRALVELDAYNQSFTSGSLQTEATVMRIEALAATGNHAAAQRLGKRFLARYPQSPLAVRVRKVVSPP